MATIESSTLFKSLKYISKNGKQFKYEIYHSNDGFNTFAVVYMLIELIDGSGVWVWSVLDEEIILLSGGQNPEHSVQVAREHFNSNYAAE